LNGVPVVIGCREWTGKHCQSNVKAISSRSYLDDFRDAALKRSSETKLDMKTVSLSFIPVSTSMITVANGSNIGSPSANATALRTVVVNKNKSSNTSSESERKASSSSSSTRVGRRTRPTPHPPTFPSNFHRQLLLRLTLIDRVNRDGGNDAAWSAALEYLSKRGLLDWSAVVGKVVHAERDRCFQTASGTVEKKYPTHCMIAHCKKQRSGGKTNAK
jgi:hypothetical protein